MAFTYNVTGDAPNQVLVITSPTAVEMTVYGGNIRLTQGLQTEDLDSPSQFAVGGFPAHAGQAHQRPGRADLVSR